MMNKFLLVVGFFIFNGVSAQIINIPDANFKARLLTVSTQGDIVAFDHNGNPLQIDANLDGEIEVSEALEVDYLMVYGQNIASLEGIQYFTAMTILGCSNNNLTSLNLTSVTSLINLSCANNQISSLDLSGLQNLEILDCDNNQLASLNVSGCTALQKIRCQVNQLSALNVSGCTPLTEINCNNNLLTSLTLGVLPNLQVLWCEQNSISSLDVSGSSNIVLLYADNNQLGTLDLSGLTHLKIVKCNNNLLTSLALAGMTALEDLSCDQNQLTSLDATGLSNLNNLNCDHNFLTSLNLTGVTSLFDFFCSDNLLQSLDMSGLSEAVFFSCANNQLQTLDVTNTYVGMLICSNNQLTSLFLKNGGNEGNGLNFSGNPNLQYICADEMQLADVQTKIAEYGYANCFVNSYCTFVPGGTSYTVGGNVTFDFDNNGCDASDINFPNFNFSVAGNGAIGNFIGNENGNYEIAVEQGMHTIVPTFENPGYFNVSPSSVNVDFPAQTSPTAQDFCVSANGNHNDIDVVILPVSLVQPGFTSTYKIIYKNKGTTMQSGTVNLQFDDATLDYISSSPTVSAQSTNNLSWNFINLMPFETREILAVLKLNAPTDNPPVDVGYVLDMTSVVNAGADETPADNTFNLNFLVLASFDPNDKTCLEGVTVAPEMIGRYMHYMIRFENTGTANAQNVVVKDMIDTSKFDVSTLMPVASSHDFTTRITETNKVEFIFENINLPFDDANNDGFIVFKIKTKPTLAVNDTFSNTAAIYFDYNFPIVTNTATTAITALGNNDFDFGSYFTIYPNPANSTLNLSAQNQIQLKTISIFNLLGQQLIVIPNAQDVSNVDVSGLQNGTYFIKVNSDKGTSSAKFLKQ